MGAGQQVPSLQFLCFAGYLLWIVKARDTSQDTIHVHAHVHTFTHTLNRTVPEQQFSKQSGPATPGSPAVSKPSVSPAQQTEHLSRVDGAEHSPVSSISTKELTGGNRAGLISDAVLIFLKTQRHVLRRQ